MFNRLFTALERIAEEISLLRREIHSARQEQLQAAMPSPDNMAQSMELAKNMMADLFNPQKEIDRAVDSALRRHS